jgi:hypothetical protein
VESVELDVEVADCVVDEADGVPVRVVNGTVLACTSTPN